MKLKELLPFVSVILTLVMLLSIIYVSIKMSTDYIYHESLRISPTHDIIETGVVVREIEDEDTNLPIATAIP